MRFVNFNCVLTAGDDTGCRHLQLEPVYQLQRDLRMKNTRSEFCQQAFVLLPSLYLAWGLTLSEEIYALLKNIKYFECVGVLNHYLLLLKTARNNTNQARKEELISK